MTEEKDTIAKYKLLQDRLLQAGIISSDVHERMMKEIENIDSMAELKTDKSKDDNRSSLEKSGKDSNDENSLLSELLGAPGKRPSFALIIYITSCVFKEQMLAKIDHLDESIESVAEKYNKGEINSAESTKSLNRLVYARNVIMKTLEGFQDWEPEILKLAAELTEIKEKIKSISSDETLNRRMRNVQVIKLRKEAEQVINESHGLLSKSRETLDYLKKYLPELTRDTESIGLTLKNLSDRLDQAETALSSGVDTFVELDLDSDLRVLVSILPAFKEFISSRKLKVEMDIEFPETYINKKRSKRKKKILEMKKLQETEPVVSSVAQDVQEIESSEIQSSNIIEPGQHDEFDEPDEKIAEEIVSETSNVLEDDKVTQIWGLVGKFVMNEENTYIGTCSYPYSLHGSHILSYYREQELSSSNLRVLAGKILETIPSSLTEMKESLSRKISRALEIPVEIALLPSYVREYCSKANVNFELSPVYGSRGEISYTFFNTVKQGDNEEIIVVSDDIPDSDRNRLIFLPSPEITLGGSLLNFNVTSSCGEFCGVVKQILSRYDSGQILGLEKATLSRDLASYILEIRYEGIDVTDPLSTLQTAIMRKLGVSEDDSLQYWNLWKYCWIEKIPVMPWDLLQAYIAFIPSMAIAEIDFDSSEIMLKRGSQPISIDVLFPHLSAYSVVKGDTEEGRILGITASDGGELEFLWCALEENEILRRIGKQTTSTAKKQLQSRISSALRIDEKNSLLPSSLLKYFLFYVTLDEFESIFDAVDWLTEKFDIRRTLINNVSSIDAGNRIIRLSQD
ncbi:MAG: hypothetical protein ACTSRU_02965 [Candidatus Hodarchaeales archaeon]